MDHASFDRIAKLLGGATTRRRGLASALGAALGLAAATATVAEASARFSPDRKRVAKPEGPCGNGSRKDNLCTKDKQCCTGYCQKGLKNKDGKGRCRCIRKGQPCKPSQTCCHGGCNNGICGKSLETCQVCASGCPYTTVQAAIDAAAAGDTIHIDAGTYAEDLTVPNMDLTLTNCNGSAVTLVNATDDSRTLVLGTSSDTAPHLTVTIRNLTITGSGTPLAGDPSPITAPTVGTGGITAYTNLIIEGTTKITGCNWIATSYGGGIGVFPQDGPLNLTVRGDAEISDNYTSGYGGGIGFDSYDGCFVYLQENAKVTRNYAGGSGGGVAIGALSAEMSGNAEISYNRAEGTGGAFWAEGGDTPPVLTMSGNASIVFNSSLASSGGGTSFYYKSSAATYSLIMHDNALIADNNANLSDDTYGCGVYSDQDSDFMILMDGNSLITRNTVGHATASSGGAGVYNVGLDIQGGASIINNTPDNCKSATLEPGSKQCGV